MIPTSLGNMDLSRVVTTTTSHSFVTQSVSNNVSRRSSITTSTAEQFASGPYEVVYTEKTTEVDGSEDVLTLHYAYDDTNSNQFDQSRAKESSLMVSEVVDAEDEIGNTTC